MPELPEVEVAARNLARWAVGHRVRAVRAEAGAKRILRPGSPAALRALAGARLRSVRRVGKNLMLTLDGPSGPIGVWSHLGMTGKWLRRRAGEPAPRYSRVEVDLDDHSHLHYADMRLFGRFRLVPSAKFEDVAELAALGRDPLNEGIDVADLGARLGRLKLPIKVAIMDQRLLPGVGNIQASEALFRAGIDPRRPAKSLKPAEVRALARGVMASIRYTLRQFGKTGADGGRADIEYVEEAGARANPFLVYDRAGEPCSGGKPSKGGTVTRIVQAGRATYFCPSFQR
jgi:formamidopyrimidine-DNA glycosylase